MASFHVGQRVRVVRAVNPRLRNTVGKEATVKGVGSFLCTSGSRVPYLVQLRGSTQRYGCDGSCIEPIIDDGRTVIDWASMPFDPRELPA